MLILIFLILFGRSAWLGFREIEDEIDRNMEYQSRVANSTSAFKSFFIYLDWFLYKCSYWAAGILLLILMTIAVSKVKSMFSKDDE